MTRDERRALGIGAVAVALVAAAYLGVGLFYGPQGGLAVPLRDAFLFEQYAASAADGHPYRFMPEDPPSTGSTSHLYPALLAVLYALGARGSALSVAGGVLSAVSLAASIWLVWLIARRIAPGALGLAVFLCAASGHLAYALFAQTDATVAVPLALGCLAALLYERPAWLYAATALLSLARPDGFVLAVAIGIASFLPGAPAISRRAMRTAAVAGVGAFAATLLLDLALTGSWIPDSIEGKGVFHDYPPLGALSIASGTVGKLFAELFLGIGDETRRMILLPLVGGLLAAGGFAARASEGALFERCWLLALLGVLVGGIASGSSGLHRDRYLAWLLPVVLIYAAAGARAFADRLRTPQLYASLAALLGGYQIAGTAHLWTQFAADGAQTTSDVRFVERIGRTLIAPGARVGVATGAGLAYFLPGRHVSNVNGIVTPAFAHRDPNVTSVELLKRDPALRFDYWLLRLSDVAPGWYRPFLGRKLDNDLPVLDGSDPLLVFEANWSALTEPQAGLPGLMGATELTRLEVGLPGSEREHAYHVRQRARGMWIEPTLVSGRLAGATLADVGRVVLGGESFRLAAPRTGRGTLVLRTSWSADAIARNGAQTQVLHFYADAPLSLIVRVGGGHAEVVEVPLAAEPDRIEEFPIELRVPAESSNGEWLDVEIDGDYVSLGYRFYEAAQTPVVR